jgi:hypothetical protein
VTGDTFSADYPTTPGTFDTTYNDSRDAFVTKLNASGSALEYSTFLGGSSFDGANGIAVLDRRAYVTGSAGADFPTTPGAFDTSFNGGSQDGFVTKLNASGSELVYSTFLGGSGASGDTQEVGDGIAVDAGGRAYVTGSTNSADYPTTPGAFDTTLNRNQDVFVTKLNATGSALDYSTFLGGTDSDGGSGIAVNESGRAYVTGSTSSLDYPTTRGAFDRTFNGNTDAFVTKLPTG